MIRSAFRYSGSCVRASVIRRLFSRIQTSVCSFLALKIFFLISFFSSIFFSKIGDAAILFFDIDIIQMRTEISLHCIQIFSPKLRLFHLFFLGKTYTFLFMCQCVDPVDLDIVIIMSFSLKQFFDIINEEEFFLLVSYK